MDAELPSPGAHDSAASPRRPRMLLVGHTYATLENRKKLQALARHFDLLCVTSRMEGIDILGRKGTDFDNDSDAASRNYRLLRLSPRGGRNFTTFFYRYLSRVMRSEPFDVVLVENEPWALVRWQTWIMARQWQRQAVFGEFTWENVKRPGLKEWLLSLIYRLMTATTGFVICGNQAAARLVKHRGGRNLLVAPQLGIDLENHRPANAAERTVLRRRHGLSPHAFVVGFAGRYTEEKGVLDLLAACEALRRQGLGELELAMVGSGPLEAELRKAASSRAWFHLLPVRPHFEIPDFLRCLDAFVLGSKPLRTRYEAWEEQFGHVLIEAMACGVTTLGSDSGAIPEVLGDETVVFPHGNVEALSALLARFIQNPQVRMATAERQQRRVRQAFTHEAIAACWAAFIHQQLAPVRPLPACEPSRLKVA